MKKNATLNIYERAFHVSPVKGSSGRVARPVVLSFRLEWHTVHEPKRKECRLRPDQLDALTALARRLNRERRGKGERITENTLIRWAVDRLLQEYGLPVSSERTT